MNTQGISVALIFTVLIFFSSCSEDFELDKDISLNVDFQLQTVSNSGQILAGVNLHLYQSAEDWENKTNAILETLSNDFGQVNWRIEDFDQDTLWVRASKIISQQLKYHFTGDSLIVLSKPVNDFKGNTSIDLNFEKKLHLTTVTATSVTLESLLLEGFPADFNDSRSNDFQFSLNRCRLSFPDTTGNAPDIAIYFNQVLNGPNINIFESIDINAGTLPITVPVNRVYNPGSGPFKFLITNKTFPDFSLIEQFMSSRTNCDYQEFRETIIPQWEQGIDPSSRYLAFFGLSVTDQRNILTLDNFTGLFPNIEEVFPTYTNIPILYDEPSMISARIQWQLNYD